MLFSQRVSSASTIRCCLTRFSQVPGRQLTVPIPGRDGLHVRDMPLAHGVFGQVFGKLPDPLCLRTGRQKELLEIQIFHQLRQLKTELRVPNLRLAENWLLTQSLQLCESLECPKLRVPLGGDSIFV